MRKALLALCVVVSSGAVSSVALASEPQSGGSLTVALWQEPESLNPFTAIQTVSRIVRGQTLEGLWAVTPEGEYVTALAAEVPTPANEGVSPDGTEVTVRLQPGLTWQDGHPVTSQDIVFTWQVIMNDANPVSSRSGYDQIEAIDTPDETTAVLRFKQPYAPYLTLFSSSIGHAVLPSHYFDGNSDIAKSDFNRKPEGTGPFMVERWNSASDITLVKNPNYRENGKPYLDTLIFKFVPSREVATAQLQSGEVDAMWNLIENQIPQLENAAGLKLSISPAPDLEYLGLNLNNPADLSQPHPILGDPKVRQALSLAINKTVLADKLLYGRARVATSAIPLGWAADDTIPASAYDPERASQLLEEAGWLLGSDGIRSKDGQKLSLTIMTTTGAELRLLAQQVIQEQLRVVGIELVIENVPSSVMFGNWESNGPLKRGQFDIGMDTWGPDIDPADYMAIRFSSSQIPSEANGGEGWNFTRIADPALDAALSTAQNTLDQEARKTAYAEALRRINDSYAYIPLYTRLYIDGFRERVQGFQAGPWVTFGWDSENWYIEGD
jgi:peptide/nickel transport system substrate-binding protein